MARPRKTGLDYFPFDCGFFSDPKITAIAGEFGLKGEIVAVKLLCAVYQEGYFIRWSEQRKMQFLSLVPGISVGLFDQILDRLLRWGFLDIGLFESAKILTSVGIQRRYFEVVKRRQIEGDLPYLLVNVTETPVNVTEISTSKIEKNRVSVTETPVNVTETPVNVAESTQKKRKVNIKESTVVDKKTTSTEEKQDFCDGLLEKYFTSERQARIEAFCMKMGVSPSDFRNVCEQIVSEWAVNEKKHKSVEDAFLNLTSAARIVIFKRSESKQDRFSKRRGTEPSVISRRDFDGTF